MTNLERQALEYYTSPCEVVRLGRVLPYLQNNKIDLPNFNPQYSDNIKIGVVVCTYGAIPFIELQLYFLKVINKIEKIAIIDDCSDKKSELIQLCKEYNVDFISTSTHLPYIKNVGSNGDTAGILFGLQWAKKNNLDILVKLSRRLIPCFEWITNFKKLVLNSHALTFSSYCLSDCFNFRTECFGMNVNAWNTPYIIDLMKSNINNNYIIFAEYWFHELAKLLSYNNISEKWLKFNKKQNLDYFKSGYALWLDLLGNNRYNKDLRNPNVLWHMYSKPIDYYNVFNKVIGNKYRLNDWMEN